MKLYNIKDLEGFFEVLDSCKGRVDLVSDEGDRINLKSKIAQYVSLSKIITDGEIAELELVAYEPEDARKIMDFMIKGSSER